MTGDPNEDAEAHRAAEQHRLERWAAHQPPPAPGQEPADPVHLIRITDLRTGVPARAMCRWSLAARLIRDAAVLATVRVTDLGPASPQSAGDWPRDHLVILKEKP